jgi:tetratricopeptide (TPR) repeat protein
VANKDTETADKPKKDPASPAKGPVPVHIGGDSIADRLLPHLKKILVGALVIAVILSAFFGYRWWKNRGKGKATDVLAKAADLDRREVKVPDPNDKPDPDQPPPEPTYATAKDRAIAVLAELDKGAGGVANDAYRGSLLLEAGRYDEAEAAYKRAASRTDLVGIVAREGLGFVAEARAHAATDAAERQRYLEAALTAFRAAQPDEKGPRRDHALYNEGRILAWMQKKTEAIAALEKALEADPDSDVAPEIRNRIASLEANP